MALGRPSLQHPSARAETTSLSTRLDRRKRGRVVLTPTGVTTEREFRYLKRTENRNTFYTLKDLELQTQLYNCKNVNRQTKGFDAPSDSSVTRVGNTGNVRGSRARTPEGFPKNQGQDLIVSK